MGEGRVARSVLYHTNEERHRAQLDPLLSNRLLIRAARQHSEFLAQTGGFSHDGPGWRFTPADRISQEGYDGATAENIWLRQSEGNAPVQLWSDDWALGREVVRDWMASPDHRANILNPAFTDVGIGVAHTRRRVYLTQNFGQAASASSAFPWLVAGSVTLVISNVVLLGIHLL